MRPITNRETIFFCSGSCTLSGNAEPFLFRRDDTCSQAGGRTAELCRTTAAQRESKAPTSDTH